MSMYITVQKNSFKNTLKLNFLYVHCTLFSLLRLVDGKRLPLSYSRRKDFPHTDKGFDDLGIFFCFESMHEHSKAKTENLTSGHLTVYAYISSQLG